MFSKYPKKTRWLLAVVLLCMMVCGLAGVIKAGPPLYRAVSRSLQLREARAEWQRVMQGCPPIEASPFFKLEIPSVNLDIPVLGNSTTSNLLRLPCISATCVDRDNAPVIVAHRDLHFRALQGVEKGDKVYLTYRSGERVEYQILQVHLLRPDEAEHIAAGVQEGTLTLITCFPFQYIGPAPQRCVVVCERKN